MTERKRVLVFAPHPDDEIIGCGASLIKHIQAGKKVTICYVGDTTAVDCAHIKPDDYRLMRAEEIALVPRKIGAQKILLKGNNPWYYNEEKLREDFLRVIREVKPNIIYIPHEGEAHPDHKIVSVAALAAAEMAPSPWFRKFGDTDECPPIETILAYEVWTSITRPTYFEPFDEDVARLKWEALALYKSQEAEKYIQAYRGMNQYRGAMKEGSADKYAEAFLVLKASRLW